MRKTERVFTVAERKAALWALVIATFITGTGILIDMSFSRPSLGSYGGSFSTASAPGVIDARPMSRAVGSLAGL